MGLGIWVHIGWFQLLRKRVKSQRECCTWARGQRGPLSPASRAMLTSVPHGGSPVLLSQRASSLGWGGRRGTFPGASWEGRL